MSDRISSEAYRKLVGAPEDGPSEMDAADFQRLLAAERSAGMASFISAPPDAGEKEAKKAHVKPKRQRDFEDWIDASCSEPVEREYVGIAGRRFRFDYAVPSVKLAFEYDGIHKPRDQEHAAHASKERIVTDSAKMNLAGLAGWLVIRVNAWSLDPKQGAFGYEHAEAALRQKGVWRE